MGLEAITSEEYWQEDLERYNRLGSVMEMRGHTVDLGIDEPPGDIVPITVVPTPDPFGLTGNAVAGPCEKGQTKKQTGCTPQTESRTNREGEGKDKPTNRPRPAHKMNHLADEHRKKIKERVSKHMEKLGLGEEQLTPRELIGVSREVESYLRENPNAMEAFQYECSTGSCSITNERYTVNLYDQGHASVYLLRWGPGQEAEWHDHGEKGSGAKVGIRVLKGPVENDFVTSDGRIVRQKMEEGKNYGLPDFYIHRVATANDQVTWSIHTYSSSTDGLDTMSFYKFDENKNLVRDKKGKLIKTSSWNKSPATNAETPPRSVESDQDDPEYLDPDKGIHVWDEDKEQWVPVPGKEQPGSRPLNNVLDWQPLINAEGTCKPGETAKQTGCIPDSEQAEKELRTAIRQMKRETVGSKAHRIQARKVEKLREKLRSTLDEAHDQLLDREIPVKNPGSRFKNIVQFVKNLPVNLWVSMTSDPSSGHQFAESHNNVLNNVVKDFMTDVFNAISHTGQPVGIGFAKAGLLVAIKAFSRFRGKKAAKKLVSNARAYQDRLVEQAFEVLGGIWGAMEEDGVSLPPVNKNQLRRVAKRRLRATRRKKGNGGGDDDDLIDNAKRKGTCEAGQTSKQTGCTPAQVTYHGTIFLKEILEDGLKVGKQRIWGPELLKGVRGRSIFVTNSPSTATYYAQFGVRNQLIKGKRKGYVLRVEIPAGTKLLKDHKGGGLMHVGDIPKEWITGYAKVDSRQSVDQELKFVSNKGNVFYIPIVVDEEPTDNARRKGTCKPGETRKNTGCTPGENIDTPDDDGDKSVEELSEMLYKNLPDEAFGGDDPVEVPIRLMSITERQRAGAEKDIKEGKKSRTPNLPLDVFYNLKTRRFIVTDGVHRLVEAHARGEKTIRATFDAGERHDVYDVNPKKPITLNSRRKGTCKPGETRKNTGCTPGEDIETPRKKQAGFELMEGVKSVKKADDFEFTGTYLVTLDNGEEHSIFFDRQSGIWMHEKPKGKLPGEQYLGTQRSDVLPRLVQHRDRFIANAKRKGTCEPGETSKQTGCTPAEIMPDVGSPGERRRPKVKTTRKGEKLYPAERKDNKWVDTNGNDLPEHIQTLGIPPAWTKVYVNSDPNGTVMAQGVDAKGRVQSRYSDSHTAQQAAAKFGRVSELRRQREGIFRELEKDSQDPELKENADCLNLIMRTGIRPGSDKDTKARHQSYGATTLEGRHVISGKKGVYLRFSPGKHRGKKVSFPIRDKALASQLVERAEAAGPDGRLFNTDDKSLREYSKTKDGGGFKTKDHRTALGTETAIAQVKGMRPPKDNKDYLKKVKEVARKVAETLGNTPAVALKSYIDPTVFSGWRHGVRP